MIDRLNSLLPLLAALCLVSLAGAVEVREVLLRPMTEGEFKRIPEYFTGEEFTGGRTILRSDPQERRGLYFVLRLDTAVRKLPAESSVRLHYITPEQPDIQTTVLPLPQARAPGREVFFGLTGDDWPDLDERPVVWQIQVPDANAELLASRESYLWSRADD
ncbi:MAG: hypothetical protein ACOCVG_02340 [Verrucomicrobiota bacterium]